MKKYKAIELFAGIDGFKKKVSMKPSFCFIPINTI